MWDLSFLVQGLTVGSLYALVGTGFNILYRPTKVFNFAQGDLVMVGAMVGATTTTIWGWPWFAGVAAAMAIVAMLALVEERLAVSPILGRSSSGTGWIISTLAFSIIIINSVGYVWGPDPIGLKPPAPLSTNVYTVFEIRISSYQAALIVFVAAFIFAIESGYATRAGKSALALAEDREAALLRGILPNRITMISFLLGGAVAGLTGVLAAPILYASTGLGPSLLLKGFVAAALGGVGNNKGVLIGGYVIGITEALSATALSPGLQEAVLLALVLCILLVRPDGLFGRNDTRVV
jgi:branched-chain amino acid transport system permease protein